MTSLPDPSSPPPAMTSLPGVEAPSERRHVGLRRVLGGLFLALAVAILVSLVDGEVTWLKLTEVLLLAGIVGALVTQRRAGRAASRVRLSRERSFTRILQGLSRSVSSESVVEAIIEELRATSGADHVVVARQSKPDGTMEVTLVAASPTIPTSKTYLRPDMATEPASTEVAPVRSSNPALQFQEAADEVARRVRAGYGLPYTLAAPLVADERRFVGALVLSKRTRDSWSELDRRLLTWAAGEVSAAFERAYALEAAETRANMDALTGLPNRRYLDELVAIVQPRRRTGDTLGVLMIDIDRFKKVNDR
ncbi:MAG: diguanylate cyclase, partial [Candidatus Limnocylindrales bacterium]